MRYFLPIFFLLLAACTRPGKTAMTSADLKDLSKQEMSKDEFVGWCAAEDNPQKHSQQIGDKVFEVKFLPAPLLAIREAGTDATAEMLAAAEEHYTDLVYFKLEIRGENAKGELLKQDLKNAAEYQQRVMYCSFRIQNDISLVTDKGDSIACAICQFERAFDVAPVTDFTIAFDRKAIGNAKSLTIILNDNLFHNGLVKFSFTEEELKCTPKIKP